MTERRTERILALIAVVTIAITGLLGFIRKADDFEDEIASLITDKEILQVEGEGRYTITESESEKPHAYMSVVGAEGYGGELRVAVRVDP